MILETNNKTIFLFFFSLCLSPRICKPNSNTLSLAFLTRSPLITSGTTCTIIDRGHCNVIVNHTRWRQNSAMKKLQSSPISGSFDLFSWELVLDSPFTNHSNLGAGCGTDVPNASLRRGGYGRAIAQEARWVGLQGMSISGTWPKTTAEIQPHSCSWQTESVICCPLLVSKPVYIWGGRKCKIKLLKYNLHQ